MRCMSSEASAGMRSSRRWPWTRMAGGDAALTWMSEAPLFTAAESSWLNVCRSILGAAPPSLSRSVSRPSALAAASLVHGVARLDRRLPGCLRRAALRLAQAPAEDPAERAVDLRGQSRVAVEQRLERGLRQHEQLALAFGAHRGAR